MLNPFRWSFRSQYVAGFLVCAALYSYALYVQFALAIEPCPMCIFQRIVFIVMGIVSLAGAIQNPRVTGRKAYGLILLLSAFVGIGIAAPPYLGTTPAARSIRRMRAGLELHDQQFPDQQNLADSVHGLGRLR